MAAERPTWVDDGGGRPADSTAAVRTVDALLPVLVTDDGRPFDAALAAWSTRGLRRAVRPGAVHRDEPVFDPRAYWRGPAWPQLTYLLWVAAVPPGRPGLGRRPGRRLAAGARRSGLAEYWHPDTGQGLGAVPQSWTAWPLWSAPG